MCCAMLSLLAAISVSARAAGDSIRFRQDPSGAISAILAGTVDPCSGSLLFPLGPPSIVRSGNEYAIVSPFAILDPLACPSPAQAYEVTALLGNLADGHYVVAWSIGPAQVRATFDVRSGLLQAATIPIPALDLPLLVVLFALTLTTGCGLLRRRRDLRFEKHQSVRQE